MAPAIKKEPALSPKEEEEKDELMEDIDEGTAQEDEVDDQEDQEMAEEDENDVIVSADKVEVISGAHGDQTAMTFCFKEEDHTLGNSLRHMINKNPQVDFAGYSIPHPSEAKLNLRIQTSDNTTAIDALKKGLGDLYDMSAHIKDAYETELRENVARLRNENELRKATKLREKAEVRENIMLRKSTQTA